MQHAPINQLLRDVVDVHPPIQLFAKMLEFDFKITVMIMYKLYISGKGFIFCFVFDLYEIKRTFLYFFELRWAN